MSTTDRPQRLSLASVEGVVVDPHILADQFLTSTDYVHQDLKRRLVFAYMQHIHDLEAKSDQLPSLARTRQVSENAFHPRYFAKVHADLWQEVEEAIAETNDGQCPGWQVLKGDIEYFLFKTLQATEGLEGKQDVPSVQKGFSRAIEVEAYSSYQLLALLIQVKEGAVDEGLLASVKAARNGRVLELKDVLAAGVTYEDFFAASTLIGDIDILHANNDILVALKARQHGLQHGATSAGITALMSHDRGNPLREVVGDNALEDPANQRLLFVSQQVRQDIGRTVTELRAEGKKVCSRAEYNAITST